MSPHEGFWEGEPAGRQKEETELESEEVEPSPSSSCKRRPWPREKPGRARRASRWLEGKCVGRGRAQGGRAAWAEGGWEATPTHLRESAPGPPLVRTKPLLRMLRQRAQILGDLREVAQLVRGGFAGI